MITVRMPGASRLSPASRAWLEAFCVVGGLAAAIVARVAATRAGSDPLVVGIVFGAMLLALVVASGGRVRIGGPAARVVALGIAVGLALVAIVPIAGGFVGAASVPGLARPASALVPWAAVTVLVAAAEEALLRGLLFDAIRRSGGTVLALGVSTLAFALLHVPLYGWHVVPLDLAVGLALGGLRIATGGIAAPAMAHAVADLATWWL
jgi:membrane protease YdiL (CAAX protease family)